MKIKYFLLFFITISCAPKIKNFELYEKQFMSKSQFLPTREQLVGKIPKIAVFELDENNNEVAANATLKASIANNVENILSKHRLASIVDRKSTTKLQDEVKLSEINKTGQYKGPEIADFIVSGAVSNAGFVKKYRSGSTYIDPKTKNLITIPPSFLYESEVGGNLKIYEVPSLAVIEVIEFSGFASRTENVQQDGGFSLGAIRFGGTQAKGIDRDDNLVRRAAEDAINSIEPDLKNALSQRGYILEKRSLNSKKTIFKISLGSENGIKNGDKFDVIAKYESQNPITNEVEIESKVIASGVISDIIDPKSSWIILKNEKDSSKVRLGDSIKMKYKNNIFKDISRKIIRL